MEYSIIRNMLIQGITDEETIMEIDSMISLCKKLNLSYTQTVGYIINQICNREGNRILDNLLTSRKSLT